MLLCVIMLTDEQLNLINNTLNNYQNAVFVDASSASSMPKTPTKEEISSIMLVEKDHEYETPVSEIPLIASIAGSLDMLRVYTTAENRDTVEECTNKVLGSEESPYWRELYGLQQ